MEINEGEGFAAMLYYDNKEEVNVNEGNSGYSRMQLLNRTLLNLSEGNPETSRIAAAIEMRVKADIPPGIIHRGFHYATAIEYPFVHEPYLNTRYGTGGFGVWYGSLDRETTIHETAFHMGIDISGIEGVSQPVIRERAVYLVHCRAVLIDLSAKRRAFPDLVAEDYGLTHQIAERLHGEGHPGLLAPSARCSGTNAVCFTPAILSDPRLNCYLTYTFNPASRSLCVERQPGEKILDINLGLQIAE